MDRKRTRERLLNALFDGVFADILRIRNAPCDGLVEKGGWWGFGDDAPAPSDDFTDYETLVARDDLWPTFEHWHQASYMASPHLSVFDAYPHLSAEDGLNLMSCGEMVAQNLRVLEFCLSNNESVAANRPDFGALFTAWNQATDRNLERYAHRRRELRYRNRNGLRFKPLPWIALMGLSSRIVESAALFGDERISVFIAGCALGTCAIQEVISHFRTRETLTALKECETLYTENALKLSRKVGFDTAIHHKHLDGLLNKVSERISHILAERREWPDSGTWIRTLSRWLAIHAHTRSRIEALRDCLRLRLGYHAVLHRGHGAWMDYLDVYLNQTDPRRAAASFLPRVPRMVLRLTYWAAVMAMAGAGLAVSMVPALTDGGTSAALGAGLAGLAGLSLLTAWWRLHRLDARKGHGTVFAKQTTDEVCRGDIRQNSAARYDQNVIALVELLAKWTQPDRSFYNRR